MSPQDDITTITVPRESRPELDLRRVGRSDHGGDVPLADLELPPELTVAERAVAALVLAGESNAAIARTRRSAISTVANQVASIYRKLGVGSRAELAARIGSRTLPLIAALSQRERQLVAYAAFGHANKFIAYELGISEASVSTALGSAAAKLGAGSRVELVRMLAPDPKT